MAEGGTVRSSGKHTLLVVDDEPDVLDSLRHLFHRTYRVLTASNGASALELLKREPVSVVLSDQRMPGMTGDVFLSRVRELYPDAVRMIFTGFADLESVIRAVNEGHIFRYIVKPWDPVELEWIIRQATEQYELLAERKRLIASLQETNANLVNANSRLSEANELKTAFIEVASHEFNTPITLVLGLSELLMLLNPNRDPGEQQVVNQISGAARQLAKLVADTLTMMHAENFQQALQRTPIDLALLLHEAADRLMPFVQKREMQFRVDVPADLGEFLIDVPKIRDTIINLLSNALKFTPDGGELGLTARLNSYDQAEILVWDKGIGIEPRALKRLFEPFFTEFDPSRHSTGDFGFEKRGLGLGLSIVRQFIDMHGGQISAESEVGKGTTVTIHLPRRPFPKPSFDVEFNLADVGEAPGDVGLG